MSRRRRDPGATHQAYGAVNLKCPKGHHLGMALLQVGRYSVSSPSDRVQLVEADSHVKVKAVCYACLEAGANPDLQASWPRLKARLDELDSDPTRGVKTYVIGGQ